MITRFGSNEVQFCYIVDISVKKSLSKRVVVKIRFSAEPYISA
ncbi:DUF2627 domain-containing protein [Enterobacter hormaechei]